MQSFAHVPTDRDHHRFHDIASRVHFLNDGGHLPLGESVFTTISNGFPGSTVLLPNLRSANFVADSRFDPTFVENLSRILAFYPSSLRHLALSVAPGSSESREKLLLNLASRFSRLSTIRLYRAALTQADARAMAKLIEHNPDLRRATIQQYITSAPVDALLNAPHLETLMIRTDRLNDSLDYRRCLRGGPFPQLKSLTIQLILDARVFDLLTNIGAHHSLQTLRVISPYDASEPLNLNSAVDAIIKHPLLHHLVLRYPLVPISRTNALQGIAACAMLELLEINVLTTYDTLPADPPIIDKVVANLLQHLPHLTELTLSFVDHHSKDPLLTFQALAVAVTHCPLLTRATLVLDTRVPFILTPVPCRNEKCRVLDFSFTVSGRDDSPIEDSKYVAGVLDQIHPEVDIRMRKDVQERYRWGDVAKILSRAHDVLDTEVENELGYNTDL